MTRFILFLVGVMYVYSLYSQDLSQKTDNMFKNGTGNLVSMYDSVINHEKSFISGEQHTFNVKSGNYPFLINEWLPGYVNFEGRYFKVDNLRYDVNKDALITNALYEGTKKIIQLNCYSVKGFIIDERFFQHLDSQNTNKRKLSEGYYELLYDGKNKLYKKWTCYFRKSNSLEKGEFVFKSDLYIKNSSGDLYEIRNKHSFIKLIQNENKEIKEFIRISKIKFYPDKENGIKKVLERLDET